MRLRAAGAVATTWPPDRPGRREDEVGLGGHASRQLSCLELRGVAAEPGQLRRGRRVHRRPDDGVHSRARHPDLGAREPRHQQALRQGRAAQVAHADHEDVVRLAHRGPVCRTPAELSGVSRIRVIGPSLTEPTRMSAPNTPRSTCAPRRSSSAQTASYAGSLTGPGRGRLPGGTTALARLAVERELADDQHGGPDVGQRPLLAQQPEVPDLAGRPRDLGGPVAVGHAEVHEQARLVDRAHRLAVDGDRCLEDSLDDRAHGATLAVRTLPESMRRCSCGGWSPTPGRSGTSTSAGSGWPTSSPSSAPS